MMNECVSDRLDEEIVLAERRCSRQMLAFVSAAARPRRWSIPVLRRPDGGRR